MINDATLNETDVYYSIMIKYFIILYKKMNNNINACLNFDIIRMY